MTGTKREDICVSVIIPIYETEAYLIRCLESVRRQTHRNLEIWMVDDGSPDQSAEIAEKYVKKDPRFHLIRQKNAGLSAARNAALDRVTGEWIAFLDSDDCYMERMIEVLLEAALSAHTQMSMCGYYKCYSDLGKKMTVHVQPAHLTDRVGLQRYFITRRQGMDNVWMKLYHRDVFEKLRFPVGVLYEDLYLRPLILDAAGSCEILDQPLCYYFKREDSITGKTKYFDAFLEALLVQARYLHEHYPELDGETRADFLKNCSRIMGTAYLMEDWKLWKRAVHFFRKAMPGAKLYNIYLKGIVALFRISPALLSRGWCVYTAMKRFLRDKRAGIS